MYINQFLCFVIVQGIHGSVELLSCLYWQVIYVIISGDSMSIIWDRKMYICLCLPTIQGVACYVIFVFLFIHIATKPVLV